MPQSPKNVKISGIKVVVVGLGISGLWTARYLARHGAEAIVSEINAEAEIDPDICREIKALGIKLESG
jgi:flavin-dependent dehydrogenase